MKVIIAGSRSIISMPMLQHAIVEAAFPIDLVISGCATGVDTLGERWAQARGIPVVRMPAKWRDRDGRFDRSAGFWRNVEMAEFGDALIAVWDGRSRGTEHMIKQARARHLKVYVHNAREIYARPDGSGLNTQTL